jgi:hypothetical protein
MQLGPGFLTFWVSRCPVVRWSLKSISSNSDVSMNILESSPYIFASSCSSAVWVLLFFFVSDEMRLLICQ